MSRGLFAHYLLVAVLMTIRNRVQLAFLADGRRRERKAETR